MQPECSIKRILIVGCPGAGKSTAARELSAITGLPLIHLDRHYWLPGWKRPTNEAWRVTVDRLIAQPAWIMDGNYGNTLKQRLAKADMLIHLDYPTWLCVWRLIRRTASGWGRTRNNELTAGCPERFDWPFLRFVLRYRKEQRPRDLQHMADFTGDIRRFTSPEALKSFVAALKQESPTFRPLAGCGLMAENHC